MNAADGELSGKVAIVTGASRGIGFAVAAAFLRAGAGVVITGRDSDTGKSAQSRLSAVGNCTFVSADQSCDADWERVVEAAEHAFGRIDILVANAGTRKPSPISEMSLEDFRSLNDVSLKGSFLGLKRVVASIRMHREGGSIIFVSSIVGKVGVPGYVNYSAAKGGVRLMAKSAALELGPENIRVNAILPGMIETDMTADFPQEQMSPMIPLGKFGKPADIANACLFLVSPRGKFVTGIELVVDGGWTVQ